jgi:hypothetical protein
MNLYHANDRVAPIVEKSRFWSKKSKFWQKATFDLRLIPDIFHPEICTGFPPKNTFIKIHRMCSKCPILSIFAPSVDPINHRFIGIISETILSLRLRIGSLNDSYASITEKLRRNS